MIYNKNASFPYPVLTENNDCYSSEFTVNVELNENTVDYIFRIKYNLESKFLNELIKNSKAKVMLVIQSKDNKFFELSSNDHEQRIKKTRLSLNKRTAIQLLIMACEDISFEHNGDIIPFYDKIKKSIIVQKNSVLGISNVILFDGSNNKPFDLFEKKLSPDLKSDIVIELGIETIIINYKHEKYQFSLLPHSTALNYPYIYMGLQKAIYRMIVELGDESDRESLDLTDIEVPTGLNLKLFNLMQSKRIDEININNIDEVIYKISDKILEKYTKIIEEIAKNGS